MNRWWWLPLITRRHRLRLFFTVASIGVAFFLFGLLQAVRSALTGGVEIAGQDKLITHHKVSIIQSLPVNYLAQVKTRPDLLDAASLSWFGGIYQDPRQQLVVFAVTDNYFSLYPELKVDPKALAAWQADRQAALVGEDMANRYHFKVNDVIPMRSNIYRRADGGNTWPMKVVGLWRSDDQASQQVFFHYEYFNESISFGKNSLGWIVSRLKKGENPVTVSKSIDAMFANSKQETVTSTEKAVAQSFANQIGDIGAILTFVVSAVFFTMLLVTANTMMQSVRERAQEIGILKTLGFGERAILWVVLGESLLITLVGGLMGLGLAAITCQGMEAALKSFLPRFAIPVAALWQGVLGMLVLGVLAGIWPALSAMRLSIVNALRRV
jgi:putative ABC transport system permease protein